MAEYMPTLTERSRWIDDVRQLRVGDVVIVIDDQTPRGQWPLGLITAVFPGADGIVRSAMVRHRGVELQRPVVKLALLLPDEEEETSTDGVVAGELPQSPTLMRTLVTRYWKVRIESSV